ncbi:hypothetical protein [Vulgatibacter incomptus]|uniref:Cytochrome c domain-containing protein n=1 Tax=Vulgatibacter incomptus TaxID=1391653 RepID=A0A0K1PFG0_9BACT|nr:hypothetical protein [Vulgatibacter incomptus]AKU92245.1 hypothetical protein AKJ08_2632 [Vulgatibacter incomptus]
MWKRGGSPAGSEAVGSTSSGLTILNDHSLAVTDAKILEPFTLERVLKQVINQSGAATSPLRLFRQWWADETEVAAGRLSPAHCDDQMAGGQPSFNDYPWECPRPEGTIESLSNPFVNYPRDDANYIPIGLFNRFDLAPLNGAHCGEYRIVFARQSGERTLRMEEERGGEPAYGEGERNLLIFEAILPNPEPGAGLDGCRRVVEFWAGLSGEPDMGIRRDLLEKFYFDGIDGFEPVVHVNHYGAALGAEGYGCSTGQIRTNQFMHTRSWELREFKLVKDCRCGERCVLSIVPITTKTNPYGELFGMGTHPNGTSLQGDFLASAVASLTDSWDVNEFTYSVNDKFNSGSSPADNRNDYFDRAFGNSPFRKKIDKQLQLIGRYDPVNMNNRHVLNRATSVSCAGCHNLNNTGAQSDMGNGIAWPESLGFTHVEERLDSNGKYRISVALEKYFLPFRAKIMDDFLNGWNGRGTDAKCEFRLPQEIDVEQCRRDEAEARERGQEERKSRFPVWALRFLEQDVGKRFVNRVH